jgi:hypothetical protein
MQPLVRGWPESPEAAKINGTGSTTTNTSKQPPSPHRWSPTTLWKKGTFSSKSRSSSLSSTDNSHSSFAPLAISIPTDSLIDDAFIDNISFSKRGSVMFGGQRALSLDSAEMEANPISDNADAQAAAPSVDTAQALGSTSLPLPRPVSGASSSEQPSTGEENRGANSPSEPSRDEPAIPPPPSTPAPSAPTPSQTHKEYAPTPDIRVMAADLDSESQKVRSLYAVGDANGDGGSKPSSRGGPIASVAEVPVEEGEINSYGFHECHGVSRIVPSADRRTTPQAKRSPRPVRKFFQIRRLLASPARG